jgi:hypothetical protein
MENSTSDRWAVQAAADSGGFLSPRKARVRGNQARGKRGFSEKAEKR